MAKTAARRFARQRRLAIAGVAAATLALGGLTACSSEDEPESASTSGGAEGEQAEDENAGSEETTEETESNGETEETTEETEETETTGSDDIFSVDETAVYDNGLEISLSAAEPYTPDEYAIGHTDGNAAYTFTVTLENTGSEAIDTTFILATARAGEDGVTAEEIYDDTMGSGFNGELLSGRSATAQYAFSAPADAAMLEIQIEQALDFDYAPAIWELEL
ncbi:DUF4352 domain-containing protein [Streptomyces litchfieldiae]|uniref:DUF4352 domain-containing protein n=1 Tax=Streptomyces litchfieldiae TaxID=3075543 RepID=A0ABU2N4H6_9ACTN|nr:DUF4352 domain-containing protein [Streptomyces sp. DSM 44938]MDT0347634.1 DUF4352 domain-containing protein [Streptomyces sp. DSM 44938]